MDGEQRGGKLGSFVVGGVLGASAALAAARRRRRLAQPDRPVVCVLGEGSAQYAITGFWTAATYGVPVTFLVLDRRPGWLKVQLPLRPNGSTGWHSVNVTGN